MSDLVELERAGGVAYLSLNRPEAGNAIDVALARRLLEQVTSVGEDPTIRCVVLRGRGPMFCVGGDVNVLHAAGDGRPELLRAIIAHLHPAVARLAAMDKPVVTAVHNAAAGAGVGLAAVGDMVLAEPDAHFTMAYSRIGLTPDAGATWLLPRLIGLRLTKELTLSNRRVGAAEAVAIGLINRVVAAGCLAKEVEALANELAEGATGAFAGTKRLLLTASYDSLQAQLDAEREEIAERGGQAECEFRLTAFLARRKPPPG